MKKFGLLCLAIVLALGTLGVGYAAWTDQIMINGTVGTGSVCLSFDSGAGEVVCTNPPPDAIDDYPDFNWSGWIPTASTLIRSCPPGYNFDSIYCVDKDVASVTVVEVLDADDNIVELLVTIHNAYPHFLGDVSFWICNCGTVPIILGEPIITQSPYLLIVYGDNIGAQLHPGDCVEISFKIGVVQHMGYDDAGEWVVDHPDKPLTPMDDTLSFTITIPATQWNEAGD